MKLRSILVTFTLTAIFLIPAELSARNVVFLGLSGPDGASVGKSLEPRIQKRLSAMKEFKTGDFIQSRRYREKINFDGHPVVSRTLVEKLEAIAPDSTLFVWGTVKDYRIRPERYLFLGAQIKGNITIDFTIYNLADKSYSYSGEVKAEAVKKKGFVLFRSVNNEVHISALDRTWILEKLQKKISEESASLISIIAKSASFPEEKIDDPEIEKHKVPSVEDVYSVPEVETPKDSLTEGREEITDSPTAEK
ncbi:MAG: hypothetical protein ACLFTW_08415 [Chitinispirillaceae bacterium]